MINDVEMLTYVLQNAEMGCHAIMSVRKNVHDGKIDGVLCNQLAKYGKIYHCANNMLRNRSAEIHHIGSVTRAMTNIAATRDLKRDSSASHIAEMIIKGSTMGVNKMARHLRRYDGSDKNVSMLARKMLDTEEESIKEIKSFLS